MTGTVVAIYIGEQRKAPLGAVERVRAVQGQGLEGDRYFAGKGSFSRWSGSRREVSLIAQEAIDAALADHRIDLTAGQHRRNIVTRGIDLSALIGQHFRIGTTVLRGESDCAPCKYLEGLVGPGTFDALKGRGGLRASVIEEGVIAVGDEIEPFERGRSER